MSCSDWLQSSALLHEVADGLVGAAQFALRGWVVWGRHEMTLSQARVTYA